MPAILINPLVRIPAGALFVSLLLAFAGCEPVDLQVIDVPPGGQFDGGLGPSCTRSRECPAGTFCEKPSCGAALGNCIPWPPACDGDARPECGCDGVSYWNECLRRAAGIESTVERGPCRTPRACDNTGPCPEGASCARIVRPGDCSGVVAGTCWVVPPAGQACLGGRPSHYFTCGGQMTQCLDACAAIRSEQPSAEFPGVCL